MATATALITIEEYLKTRFRPDAHFVDGRIEERVAGYSSHARMLGLVAATLEPLSEDHFGCLILRLRTSATRIRVCDVVVLRKNSPDQQIPSSPPEICIEILDPSQEPESELPVLADYASMGVENIWLINIAQRTGYTYKGNALHPVIDGSLSTVDNKINLQLRSLFEALDNDLR